MVTWLLMHEHALSHIMLYDDSRITMRDAQVHVAQNVQNLSLKNISTTKQSE